MNIRNALMKSVTVLAIAACVAQAQGAINLELRPVGPPFTSGDTVEIGLYAVSDDQTNQVVRGLQVIVVWDPLYLELTGINNDGPYAWIMSGFFDDSDLDRLNADCGPDAFCNPDPNDYTGLPYNDGTGYYQAVGNFSEDAFATPEGLLAATLQFRALASTLETTVSMPSELGGITETTVIGDPGEYVTGTLNPALVQIDPAVDWGELSAAIADGSCFCADGGDELSVALSVSGLIQPINGVQALVDYDHDVLTLVDVSPGDGLGSPWDGGVLVSEEVDGVLVVGSVVLTGGTDQAAVVATMRFTVDFGGASGPSDVVLLPQLPPLVSKLTDAGSSAEVIPALSSSAVVSRPGDSDADGDVDLADYDEFASCYTGTVGGPFDLTGVCCCLDFDSDEDVDCEDWEQFVIAWTEPGEPPELQACVPEVCGNDIVDVGIGEECDGTADAACPGLCLPPGDPNECTCEVLAPDPPEQPGEDPWGSHLSKNRNISFVLPPSSVAAAGETAIRVTLTSLYEPYYVPDGAPDFSAWEGNYRWVNAFSQGMCVGETNPFDRHYCTTQKDCDDYGQGGTCQMLTCPDSPNFPGTFYRCAVLGCSPEYRDWRTELGGEALHVTGKAVVPSSLYSVVHLDSVCEGQEPTCTAVSTELLIETAQFGDVDPYTDPLVVLDIARVVDHVKGLPYPTEWPPESGTALFKPRVHLRPNLPDALGENVTVLDIAMAVDAVKGNAYWHFGDFGPCTDACPGEAACP